MARGRRLALRWLLLAAAVLWVGLLPGRARAFVLAEDPLEETSTELGLTARFFAFVLTGPTLRTPYNQADQDPTGLSLTDLRVTFAHRSPRWKVVAHNQLSMRLRAHDTGGVVGLGRGQEPRRWLPLQADLAQEGGLLLREDLDWAFVALTLGPVTLTVGRQPVTLGRGTFWKPLDLVSTFTLTEVDTEFKPGADAVRVEWQAASRTVITALAAAGRDPADNELALRGSSMILRGQQGWDTGEAAVTLGFVRRDIVLGLDAVWDAGALDLYGEATVTVVTDQSLTPREQDTGRAVPRVVLGARARPRSHVMVGGELYYQGFGTWDTADYYRVVLSERVAMGELFGLGRLYAAALCDWEAHALVHVTGALVANLHDPSALLSLGARYNLAANVELTGGVYLPLGRVPHLTRVSAPGGASTLMVGEPRSEFGLYPTFVYLELKAVM